MFVVADCTYSKDFQKLINSKDFSDVHIQLTSLIPNHPSETTLFYGHKIFLCRSEKLRQKLTEKANTIEILQITEKISKEIFQDILKFLYTDQISETTDSETLKQQIKYQKEIEESGISEHFSENVPF
jgi:hypothetical protein